MSPASTSPAINRTTAVSPFDVARIRADFPIMERMIHGSKLVYLDSVICIYAVEGASSFQARAKASTNGRAGSVRFTITNWATLSIRPQRSRPAADCSSPMTTV